MREGWTTTLASTSAVFAASLTASLSARRRAARVPPTVTATSTSATPTASCETIRRIRSGGSLETSTSGLARVTQPVSGGATDSPTSASVGESVRGSVVGSVATGPCPPLPDARVSPPPPDVPEPLPPPTCRSRCRRRPPSGDRRCRRLHRWCPTSRWRHRGRLRRHASRGRPRHRRHCSRPSCLHCWRPNGLHCLRPNCHPLLAPERSPPWSSFTSCVAGSSAPWRAWWRSTGVRPAWSAATSARVSGVAMAAVARAWSGTRTGTVLREGRVAPQAEHGRDEREQDAHGVHLDALHVELHIVDSRTSRREASEVD